MSGIFKEIITDVDNLEQDILGPDYNYYTQIKNPSELRMSSDGTIPALTSDIEGIIDYVKLLVSGSSEASKTGQPLGNRFFMKTLGQCKDYKTGKLMTRSMYIDNIPTQSIPIISNLTGMEFPDFRGVVPGILEDTYDINPIKLFRAFGEGSEPMCANVELNTIDENNVPSVGTGYVPISELQDLENSGSIQSGTVTTEMKNALSQGVSENSKPVPTTIPTKSATQETFKNLSDAIYGLENTFSRVHIKKNTIYEKALFIGIASVLLYFIFKTLRR